MAAHVTREQAQAMDDTMGFDAAREDNLWPGGQGPDDSAQRFANKHRHLLNELDAAAEYPLAAAIVRREKYLAQNPMPGWVRKSLERRNADAEQVMSNNAAQDEGRATGAQLGLWIFAAVLGAVCAFALWCFVQQNWPGVWVL